MVNAADIFKLVKENVFATAKMLQEHEDTITRALAEDTRTAADLHADAESLFYLVDALVDDSAKESK